MSAPDRYVPYRGDASYSVSRYELALDYRPETNALSGRASLFVEARQDLCDLELDLVGLGVDEVTVAGRRVRYRHRAGRLRVSLAEPVPVGARLVVGVRWSGRPGPATGPWGDVGWEELDDGSLVAGQPDGAPTWFPCNDRTSDKASYRTTVKVDSAYEVVANGVLVERTPGGSRTTWTYEQDEPMATYLATVQIGRYERRVLSSGPVPQEVVRPRSLAQRADHDTGRQPEMMDLFVRLFGPYPFAGYTLVVTADELEIPLEAQGLAVFGANHVDGTGRYERLVAHELAHQWFGNSVTVSAWEHVWLNEGFACYAEWLWSEASGGPSADQLARTHHARLSALPQDLLLRDPGPELMFDDRVYKRGALALHALRRLSGDEVFFGLLTTWTSRHRHGSVTTEDFIALVDERVSPGGRQLLSRWLDDLALPALG